MKSYIVEIVKKDDNYIAFLKNHNSTPVISGKNIDELKDKFKKAFRLYFIMRMFSKTKNNYDKNCFGKDSFNDFDFEYILSFKKYKLI